MAPEIPSFVGYTREGVSKFVGGQNKTNASLNGHFSTEQKKSKKTIEFNTAVCDKHSTKARLYLITTKNVHCHPPEQKRCDKMLIKIQKREV